MSNAKAQRFVLTKLDPTAPSGARGEAATLTTPRIVDIDDTKAKGHVRDAYDDGLAILDDVTDYVRRYPVVTRASLIVYLETRRKQLIEARDKTYGRKPLPEGYISLLSLAEEFGVSRTALRYWLRRRGIVTRTVEHVAQLSYHNANKARDLRAAGPLKRGRHKHLDLTA
jgi:hypothetical protein